MDFSDSILGSVVAKELSARVSVPILQIGSDRFSRNDLAQVECFNFAAAQNLSAILNKELKVRNLSDVYHKVPPAQLALPRLGAISLAVLGAAFEARGLGGNAPLENWLKRHQTKIQTFHTIKLHDEKERADEKRARRLRKRQRKNQAHEMRVARFESRNGDVAHDKR